MRMLTTLLAAGIFQFTASAHAEDIAVLTPYLSSVATNEMIETFKSESAAKGWTVNVVDTRGDFQQLASRVEDVANAGVKAIVLVSVDPNQIGDQVAAAADKGIPVIALDGALAKGVAINITTDNFALGTLLSDYLFKAMGDKGNIVKFFHSAHPGVRQRELALDKALGEHPGIKVIAEHYVQVPGPIDNARQAMETFARQYGDEINGVWAAWDEPAIGALLAIQSDKPDSKALIAGIDGNPQAIDLIKQCTNLVATVRQDFPGIAKTAVQEIASVIDGKKPEKSEIFVSANVIDRASLGVTCN
ncbi:MAG: sugar ABC transporter substrate-binding protein [Proteobacteria bacterium]|jgi:ribose transport system substrate-binding protein|uniref:sugar ABC transporter substrate-binding protein n=1 Tax=Hyphomicrobiales TaxID=356 RepID=UPI00058B9DCD|nr:MULTISPECIES: sugar ABC transporter substrate-binding protein [Phyllobacteriaceae]MCA0276936.1 sugar ABC transporter substrate-binding protein [Pseudomonadota bacterium]MCX8572958.1 sugar ABC transporter substrate-binding protein [Aminobacter sp. MET-1]